MVTWPHDERRMAELLKLTVAELEAEAERCYDGYRHPPRPYVVGHDGEHLTPESARRRNLAWEDYLDALDALNEAKRQALSGRQLALPGMD